MNELVLGLSWYISLLNSLVRHGCLKTLKLHLGSRKAVVVCKLRSGPCFRSFVKGGSLAPEAVLVVQWDNGGAQFRSLWGCFLWKIRGVDPYCLDDQGIAALQSQYLLLLLTMTLEQYMVIHS